MPRCEQWANLNSALSQVGSQVKQSQTHCCSLCSREVDKVCLVENPRLGKRRVQILCVRCANRRQ